MSIRVLLCSAAAAVLLAPAASAADQNVKVGGLRCEVSAGLGLIIASSKEMSCTFKSSSGYSENYYGTIRKFGLDIGATSGGVLAWDVFAPTQGRLRGALAGDYAGVDASATVGAGGGANVLVGGLNRSISLQPLSIEVQNGLALAAGVASLMF